MVTIKKGDAYPFPVIVRLNGQTIDEGTLYSLETVELSLQDLTKEWKADGSGDVTFENGVFYINLSQQETFNLRAGKIKLDVRVKTIDGWVQGTPSMSTINVVPTISRKEL